MQGLTDCDGFGRPDADRSGALDAVGATQAVRSSCWPARTAPCRDRADARQWHTGWLVPSLPIATMLSGLNHLTLAVADLPLSLDFYVRVLGFRPRAQWDTGAYLGLGNLWLCLSSDEQRRQARSADYTHYAFTLAQQDFAHFVEHARSCGVREWKSNHSEGDSFYFLDPDGHQLEAHVGSLESRLAQCRLRPYAGMRFFD